MEAYKVFTLPFILGGKIMKNKLYNLLAAKQNTLAAFLEESGTIPHPTGNGDN